MDEYPCQMNAKTVVTEDGDNLKLCKKHFVVLKNILKKTLIKSSFLSLKSKLWLLKENFLYMHICISTRFNLLSVLS